MSSLIDWDYAFRFLNITLVNIVLSGDNVLVIGMAAASLPKAKRSLAVALGGGGAILLRILLTLVAARLMLIPYLSAVGGLALIWVVWNLLKVDSPQEGSGGEAANHSLRKALFLILSADLMMSIDNVLAVAGAAQGDFSLLVAGLLVSMPILMVAGGFLSNLIDKAYWIVYVGGGAISFTAVRMFFEDGAVHSRIHASNLLVIMISAICAVLIPALFLRFHRSAAARLAEELRVWRLPSRSY
jgi:YjbE family integral membrane protein